MSSQLFKISLYDGQSSAYFSISSLISFVSSFFWNCVVAGLVEDGLVNAGLVGD